MILTNLTRRKIFIYIVSLLFTVLVTCIFYNNKIKYPIFFIVMLLGISLVTYISDTLLDRFTLKLSLGKTRKRFLKEYFVNILIIYIIIIIYILIQMVTLCVINKNIDNSYLMLLLLYTSLITISGRLTLCTKIYISKKISILLMIIFGVIYILFEYIKFDIILLIIVFVLSIFIYTYCYFFITKRYKLY